MFSLFMKHTLKFPQIICWILGNSQLEWTESRISTTRFDKDSTRTKLSGDLIYSKIKDWFGSFSPFFFILFSNFQPKIIFILFPQKLKKCLFYRLDVRLPCIKIILARLFFKLPYFCSSFPLHFTWNFPFLGKIFLR